ncbi:tryptophan 7-halogenase [Aurantiacibacter sp. MUD11]|uniref:tryptophan halogenase family protein n=1 Tax=Aurantiacibacter sp. MUD11 TaxID=3003265 RepID=UPI0022AACB09|nr:tryptophan halogenase family protein [Aurantiacibacter sp. MUD11]WAT17710.1 tryptophan 7-halogenase [Aurantiacibacter sp. MUD11]
MTDKPYRFVIVGGGSAGWITACLVEREFSQAGDEVEIILIESSRQSRIGVGEATIPTLKRTLETIGIEEQTFLRETGATFKHAIRFNDWLRKGHYYFHPFEALRGEDGPEASSRWLARNRIGEARPFAYEVGVQSLLAEVQRSPKTLVCPDYQGELNYAYHVDADKLADLLQRTAENRGVEHIHGDVSRLLLEGTNGHLSGVELTDGSRIAGDFFFDCTGFASVLHNQIGGGEYVSYGEHLLCDRAVAFRRPYREGEAILPYTTSHALEHGWSWQIGLQQRVGQGYVYCSQTLNPHEAEHRLREHASIPEDAEARHLSFRTGRVARCWEKNCLAIGLSAGFVEPLESTGIFLIEDAARMFCRVFDPRGDNEAARRQFNRYMAEQFDEIRDFIVLHYCLSTRTDSEFWRAVTKDKHIPERLQELLEIWQTAVPITEDLPTDHVFSALNYAYVLYGMECLPKNIRSLDGSLSRSGREHLLDSKRLNLLATLPMHEEYLAKFR